MSSAFLDYYRCPDSFEAFAPAGSPSVRSGFFRFGDEVICYGQCYGAEPAPHVWNELYESLGGVTAAQDGLRLPFDPSDVVRNLRYERYIAPRNGASATVSITQRTYYFIRPIMPVPVRKHLQRLRLKDAEQIGFPKWPVDGTVECIFERLMTLLLQKKFTEKIPFIWFWPNGSPGCTIMTHDVETESGRDFCPSLMDLDAAYQVKASFQVIPETRYRVPSSFLEAIRRRGFEVNVHDLNHDGRLYDSKERFLQRVELINRYGKEFGAAGFRSGALYHNLDWYPALDFSYDMSVPCVGHLEAQRGGCCSVMPYFVGKVLEIPVTATQDYSLIHILKHSSIGLWKRQLAAILERHGLASFIVHPDYIMEASARGIYTSLLAYLSELRSESNIWMASPGEVNEWWRARSQMNLVRRGENWAIEGPHSDKAQIAYAVLDGGRLRYEFDPQHNRTLSPSESLPEEQPKGPAFSCAPPACVEVISNGQER